MISERIKNYANGGCYKWISGVVIFVYLCVKDWIVKKNSEPLWLLSLILIIIAVYLTVAVFAGYIKIWYFYRKLYSIENFQEYEQKLLKALAIAQNKSTEYETSIANVTAFETAAGLKTSVSFEKGTEITQVLLHFAFSHGGGLVTTHAACSRFSFFTLTLLRENKIHDIFSYYTQSNVYHLLISMDSTELLVHDFNSTYSIYKKDYTEIEFTLFPLTEDEWKEVRLLSK